jgi:hypothetical protein
MIVCETFGFLTSGWLAPSQIRHLPLIALVSGVVPTSVLMFPSPPSALGAVPLSALGAPLSASHLIPMSDQRLSVYPQAPDPLEKLDHIVVINIFSKSTP